MVLYTSSTGKDCGSCETQVRDDDSRYVFPGRYVIREIQNVSYGIPIRLDETRIQSLDGFYKVARRRNAPLIGT